MRTRLLVLIFALAAVSAFAQSIGSLTLSDAKISDGLKQALQVGTDNAVKLTGRPGGYFNNDAIKILMPPKLRTLETGLRAIGYGPKVDEFVLAMNRSAEKAAPQAKAIFRDAILNMSINDARQILKGSDTAATEYFKAKTSEQLATAFKPIVTQTMNETGVTRQYHDLIGQYSQIPFANSPQLDIDNYVVSKSLDGLFYMLGQEEKKIRKNPAARVTDLLKVVFGNRVR